MTTTYIVVTCKTGSLDEWIEYEGSDKREALRVYRELRHRSIDAGYHVEIREMCREYSEGDLDAYNYEIVEDQ